MSLFSVNVYHHVVCPDPPGGPNGFELLRAEIQSLKESIMATLAEHAAELAGVKETLVKARDEIIARVSALEALLTAAGQTTPEIDAEMSALRAVAEALDALNPDAPPAPEPEPEPEPAP